MSTGKKKIAFTIRADEAGHRFPAIAFAKQLVAIGFDVTFVGIVEDRHAIELHGFNYQTIAEHIFPADHVKANKTIKKNLIADTWSNLKKFRALLEDLSSSSDILKTYDLVICDAFSLLGALMAMKAQVTCVLFQPSLSKVNASAPKWFTHHLTTSDGRLSFRYKFSLFINRISPLILIKKIMTRIVCMILGTCEKKIVKLFGLKQIETRKELLLYLPNLILCPRAFDFPVPVCSNEFHVESFIDLERQNEDFDWSVVNKDRSIILVSMGSQQWLMKNPQQFYRTILQVAVQMEQYHFIFSAGESSKLLNGMSLPSNVSIHSWIPQLTVLSKTKIMITHAGLGSIKECIHMGVPMICFPVSRDQPGNAARVYFHKLGLRSNYEKVTTYDLRHMINEIATNPLYSISVNQMREQSQAANNNSLAVKIVENIIGKQIMKDSSKSEINIHCEVTR